MQYLILGGVTAGLCLWSSTLGQQYVVALTICAPFYWKKWRKGLPILAGFSVAAVPIVSYMIFHWTDYTFHQSTRLSVPSFKHLWDTFFTIPSHSYFLPDTLLIPLPYYILLISGIVAAIWMQRFYIVMLALLPVVGVFLTGGPCVEHRLLMAIPFWVILIGYGFNTFRQLRAPLVLLVTLVAIGLVPSIQYIYTKAKDSTSIHAFDKQHTI